MLIHASVRMFLRNGGFRRVNRNIQRSLIIRLPDYICIFICTRICIYLRGDLFQDFPAGEN